MRRILIDSFQLVHVLKQSSRDSRRCLNWIDGYKACTSIPNSKRSSKFQDSVKALSLALEKSIRISVESFVYSKVPYNLEIGVKNDSNQLWTLLVGILLLTSVGLIDLSSIRFYLVISVPRNFVSNKP